MKSPRIRPLLSAIALAALAVGWFVRSTGTGAADARVSRNGEPAHRAMGGAVAAGEAASPQPAIYRLFDADHRVLASRETTAGAPGVRRREWLLAGADPGERIRVIEEERGADGSGAPTVIRREAFVAGEVIVANVQPADAARLAAAFGAAGAAGWQRIPATEAWLVRFADPDLDTIPRAIAQLEGTGGLHLRVEGNGLGRGGMVPNDPRFAEQYALRNTGQTGGAVGADIAMTAAWDRATASPDVVVAVLDTGLEFTHPDLAENVYSDARELTANGVDDDGNGFVDDHRGWDFVNNDNNPSDDHDHGTHVSGILGARGNNGVGIAGVCWRLRILPVKVLNSANAGTTVNLIAGFNYARTKSPRLIHMSLIDYPFNATLSAAIDQARTEGILVVVSAGNSGTDNDVNPNYPSAYPQDNVIAVANTNSSDLLHTGGRPSNFGATTVDLAAPGTLVLSTVRGAGYSQFTGTSMAAPHVTGTAALLLGLRPNATVAELRGWILGTVEGLPDLIGRCATGGRLDADAALAVAALPAITGQPASQTVASGGAAGFAVAADGSFGPFTYQWSKDGVDLAGATAATLDLANVQVADAGIYRATVRNAAGATLSRPAVLGVTVAGKVSGAATEVGSDIQHPNGNVYDQVLLTGAAATIRADPGQVTRLSYVDLSDDIVQVEFSGAGTLAIALDPASGPAAPAHYVQPGTAYMKGHARLVIAGADESTNVAVFSVGRLTAVNQALFRDDVAYDGFADLAAIAVASTNGRCGGIRTANAVYSGARGPVGLCAPGIALAGPVRVGDLSAADEGRPLLVFGAAADALITGGDLWQANGRPVETKGLTQLRFVDGTDSHNRLQPAQANRARLEEDGRDVTAAVVVPATPSL